MIVVDTSVWVDHLRQGDRELVDLLDNVRVLAHPLIIGELALGQLRNREFLIDTLQALPSISVASDTELLKFIAANSLAGTGIGFVDAHLLASLCLAPGSLLWTRDKRLAAVAHQLSLHCGLA